MGKRKTGTLSLRTVVLLWAGVSAAALALVCFVPLGNSGMLFEIHEIFHGRPDDSFGSWRWGVWRHTLDVSRHSLLFGTGPDMFYYAMRDYLQATGSLISPDISWFYKPVFQLFASDTVATRDLAASAGSLAVKAVVAFLLLHHCFSMELQKGHLAPWLRSSVRRVWIGLPLGAILALWGKRYAPGGMEELWLLTFGMISFEDLSGFFLILVNSLPFLLACFLFGINQSEDSLAVNVLSVTREGTRRFWWRRRQVTLFVSSTCYALMILLGTAFTGFCFGLRVADLSEAADGLLALICTKMAVGYVLLLGSSVLCLLMDARYVFLLMSGVYMGGQLLTFVPRTAFVTAVLRIFLPCRASLLLHECPKALQGMEDLFSRGIEGLHPEMTAVLSGISAVLLFGIGSRLAERTDLL